VTDLDRVFTELEHNGLLLLVDARLPCVAALVAGAPVQGSWWAHSRARDIYRVATSLGEHPDVVVAKLVSGKLTFVHRRLWPALVGAATAGESWQLTDLTPAARKLLERVRREGETRSDRIRGVVPAPEAVRQLERKLLVHSDEIHTEKGSHSKVLETWERWAKRAGSGIRPLPPERARAALERAVERLDRAWRAAGRLPWLALPLCLWVALLGASNASERLRSESIVASEDDAELEVRLPARAPGTAWERDGRECAVLRLSLDGRYDQHVFLLGGGEERTYSFLVGPLARGRHRLEIDWEKEWLRAGVSPPVLGALETVPIGRSAEAILRAPILHIRGDTVGRFNDAPLVLYWDREAPDRVVYTFIFSNEDGGTNTERLMARWGRTTDIEWCYAYTSLGGRLEEEYQARDHKTLPFRGRKRGAHPILYDATRNNVFADALEDAPEVRVRLLPVFADLGGRARELVMDRFPWTYAIMAAEMERENKISPPPHETGDTISDPRNYAYLEVCADQRGTELFFELDLGGGTRWYASDHSDAKARIGRSGCMRSAVELPAGTAAADLRALRIQCRPAPPPEGERPVPAPGAVIRHVPRLFLLEANYLPGPNLLDRAVGRRLRPGDSVTIAIR